MTVVRSYASESNERWIGFAHRPGDIVISTRSKCGTTWAQMICCLLVHQRAELPAPLGVLSPWLDWRVEPIDVVRDRLAAQDHRRVIKTHVPLDGLPLDRDVTYLVVARHPLDVAVSFFHHVRNLDQARMAELKGAAPTAGEPPDDLPAWLDQWIDDTTAPRESLDTLPGNLHHLQDAWGRRTESNVILLHYDELQLDLEGQMRRVARALDIEVPDDRWDELVGAADFVTMKEHPVEAGPDHLGVFKDRSAFFRSGRSGEGELACSPPQLERYRHRVVELADPGVLRWLHRDPAWLPPLR